MEKTVEEKLITLIAKKFKVGSYKIPHYPEEKDTGYQKIL